MAGGGLHRERGWKAASPLSGKWPDPSTPSWTARWPRLVWGVGPELTPSAERISRAEELAKVTTFQKSHKEALALISPDMHF